MLEKIIEKTTIELLKEKVHLTLYQKDDGHAYVHEQVINGKWSYSFTHQDNAIYPIRLYYDRIRHYMPE